MLATQAASEVPSRTLPSRFKTLGNKLMPSLPKVPKVPKVAKRVAVATGLEVPKAVEGLKGLGAVAALKNCSKN